MWSFANFSLFWTCSCFKSGSFNFLHHFRNGVQLMVRKTVIMDTCTGSVFLISLNVNWPDKTSYSISRSSRSLVAFSRPVELFWPYSLPSFTILCTTFWDHSICCAIFLCDRPWSCSALIWPCSKSLKLDHLPILRFFLLLVATANGNWKFFQKNCQWPYLFETPDFRFFVYISCANPS